MPILTASHILLLSLCLMISIDAECIEKTITDSVSYSNGDLTYTYKNSFTAPLKIRLNKSSNLVSAELFVGFGYQPTDFTEDCGYGESENTEYCYFNPSEVGTYYIMIAVHQSNSYDVTLTIAHEGNCSSFTSSPTPSPTFNDDKSTTNNRKTSTTMTNDKSTTNNSNTSIIIIAVLVILFILIIIGIILIIYCRKRRHRVAQMPDGKMVAAQIMGPVSSIQMNKDQNPSAPALYHSQKYPPAYNPNGKEDSEEDEGVVSEEGEGVVTKVEDVYI